MLMVLLEKIINIQIHMGTSDKLKGPIRKNQKKIPKK